MSSAYFSTRLALLSGSFRSHLEELKAVIWDDVEEMTTIPFLRPASSWKCRVQNNV